MKPQEMEVQPEKQPEAKPTMDQPQAKRPPTELSAEAIFTNATAGRRYRYDDPDLGTVWIKRMSAPEVRTLRDGLDRDSEGNVEDPYGDAKLIQVAVVDGTGKPKFTLEQIPKIAAMANNVLAPLVDACMERNAISGRGIEAIRKNCEATPGSDSV